MKTEEVFAEIDRLYAANEAELVEGYILDKLSVSAKEGDENAMIQLLNELIGHYRETGRWENAFEIADKSIAVASHISQHHFLMLQTRTAPQVF